ncbi:MAG: DUF3703 domain-containing protein [Alphaproteobacteria bacterium]|nr:DUF3703 domain-containing protein [Alphaproteobacteria bacterium]
MTEAVKAGLAKARRRARAGDSEGAWAALERAHIVSQPALRPHLRVHCAMFELAIANGDAKEAIGQITGLALAPFGQLLGRTPWGNPGRATVSKFARASLPEDVTRLYAQAGIKVR